MAHPPANIYRDQLTEAEKKAMLRALKLDDLKNEIALLRTRIGSIAALSDPQHGGTLEANRLLCRMVDTLTHLVAVQNRLVDNENADDKIRDFNTRFLERARQNAQTSG